MEHVDEIIQSFVKNRIGGVMVLDQSGKVVYRDERILLSEKALLSFLRRRPGIDEAGRTWEFSDSISGKYYRVETYTVPNRGREYQCHLFTDVSDYASLFQDISEYSRHIADISNFQSHIMAKLSQPYETCLADLTSFCGSMRTVLYLLEEEDQVLRISYYGKYKKEILPLTEETDRMLYARRFDMIDGYYCFLSDDMGGQRCAVFLLRGKDFNENYFRDSSVYNVIRLYIENGLLRQQIIFDSEHDKLTGLYNKGKFLDMKSDDFGHPDQIVVFNMDVNNLKLTNDLKGHEAGDQLIIRAASSVLSVTSDRVLGFRLGGDEFMIVALDCSEAEGEEVEGKG